MASRGVTGNALLLLPGGFRCLALGGGLSPPRCGLCTCGCWCTLRRSCRKGSPLVSCLLVWGVWWCRSPTLLAWKLMGLVAVLGAFSAIPAGAFWYCCLFFPSRVWHRFCWMGVLVVGVGCVLALWPAGLRWFAGLAVGCGGAWPAGGGGPLRGGVLLGGVRWLCPLWGCVAGCCVFGVWCSWIAVSGWRGGLGFWGLAPCGLCAYVGGFAVGSARLRVVRVGVPRLFGVSVLVCPVRCGVACLFVLGPALSVVGLVSGGPVAFLTRGPSGMLVGVLVGVVTLLPLVGVCAGVGGVSAPGRGPVSVRPGGVFSCRPWWGSSSRSARAWPVAGRRFSSVFRDVGAGCFDVLVWRLWWQLWVSLVRCRAPFRIFLLGRVAVCGCGSVGSGGHWCVSSRFRLGAGTCGFLLPLVVPWGQLAVPVWAASLGVGFCFSWCPGGRWSWSTSYLAEGFVGWLGVLDGVPPVLAGCLGAVPCFPWSGCGFGGVWSVFRCPGPWGCGGMLVAALGSSGWSVWPAVGVTVFCGAWWVACVWCVDLAWVWDVL